MESRPGRRQVGVVEARQPGVKGGRKAAVVVAAQGHQLPGGGELLHLHGGVLELGLARDRVAGSGHQRIHAGAAHELAAPVHRQPGVGRAQGGAGSHAQAQAAALVAQGDEVAAAHAVPLVAHAPAVQVQRQARVGGFGGGAVLHFLEAGSAAGRRVDAVAIEASGTPHGAGRQRPLLRAGGFEQAMAETVAVEVAADRGGAVFEEDLFGRAPGQDRSRLAVWPASASAAHSSEARARDSSMTNTRSIPPMVQVACHGRNTCTGKVVETRARLPYVGWICHSRCFGAHSCPSCALTSTTALSVTCPAST